MCFLPLQDFPLLQLDSLLLHHSSSILGFSIFNSSHTSYQDLQQGLRTSWREECDPETPPGPGVRHARTHTLTIFTIIIISIFFIILIFTIITSITMIIFSINFIIVTITSIFTTIIVGSATDAKSN